MSVTAYAYDQEGFGEVCKIYTEARNSNMDVQAASAYVVENVSKRVESKEALQAHEAVMHVMADQRYILFKGSAEHILKMPWECAAMQSMMEMKIKQQN